MWDGLERPSSDCRGCTHLLGGLFWETHQRVSSLSQEARIGALVGQGLSVLASGVGGWGNLTE